MTAVKCSCTLKPSGGFFRFDFVLRKDEKGEEQNCLYFIQLYTFTICNHYLFLSKFTETQLPLIFDAFRKLEIRKVFNSTMFDVKAFI
ncbi:hypothetical protein AMECASPLE_009442 [Ameca splendens]|uniref:Uncharacterized protein n=1 Tax=Ameca splendens TaxID=208324 RepID=A0ABV0XPD5_9TELE